MSRRLIITGGSRHREMVLVDSLIIRDIAVVKGEAEHYERIPLTAAVRVEVVASGQARRQLGHGATVPAPETADRIAIPAVPLIQPGGKAPT